MRLSAAPDLARHRQRGAFSILSAFALLVALACLVLVIDSGRLYMEQRRLQKVADTAALESVTRLPDGNCAKAPEWAIAFARENARLNGFLNDERQGLTAVCANVSSREGLRQTMPSAAGRAVQVTVTHRVPASLVIRGASLFNRELMPDVELLAQAVALRDEPGAAFSVGAQLLRLENDKLLGQLLKAVGLDVQRLTVLDSAGLANASIAPSGLLRALGIDIGIDQLKALSPQGLVDLVDTRVGLLGLDDLLSLSLEVVSDSVLRAQLEVLRADILNNPILRDVDLHLFGTPDSPGLLSIASTPEGSIGPALDTQVNLGDLLKTGILIGASGRGLLIPELNVLGLAKVELGVVEPPSLGVGPIGTQAYNAQIRLYVGVDTNQLLGGILAWLTDTVLGTRINLPIWIDVVSGHGTLEAIDCTASPPTAEIRVESDILNACVGKMPDALKWSSSQSCEYDLQDDELIRLLHLPVLSGRTHIPALRHDESVTVAVGETVSTTPNALRLGDTVEDLVGGLLDLLGGLFREPSLLDDSHLDYSQQAKQQQTALLAEQYLEATKVNGFYNVDKVTALILQGSDTRTDDGRQALPPLVDADWFLSKSIPTSCLLTVCPASQWTDGTFSQAFHAYTSVPYSLLDIVGIPTLGNGYHSCAGLLSSLLGWNKCVRDDLVKLLQDKPGGINLTSSSDGASVASPASDGVTCSGALCVLLKPVLALVKPILNGIGDLLTRVLADALGLELGRTDVELHAVSCGIPKLVR